MEKESNPLEYFPDFVKALIKLIDPLDKIIAASDDYELLNRGSNKEMKDKMEDRKNMCRRMIHKIDLRDKKAVAKHMLTFIRFYLNNREPVLSYNPDKMSTLAWLNNASSTFDVVIKEGRHNRPPATLHLTNFYQVARMVKRATKEEEDDEGVPDAYFYLEEMILRIYIIFVTILKEINHDEGLFGVYLSLCRKTGQFTDDDKVKEQISEDIEDLNHIISTLESDIGEDANGDGGGFNFSNIGSAFTSIVDMIGNIEGLPPGLQKIIKGITSNDDLKEMARKVITDLKDSGQDVGKGLKKIAEHARDPKFIDALRAEANEAGIDVSKLKIPGSGDDEDTEDTADENQAEDKGKEADETDE